jgi:hypothetical protein
LQEGGEEEVGHEEGEGGQAAHDWEDGTQGVEVGEEAAPDDEAAAEDAAAAEEQEEEEAAAAGGVQAGGEDDQMQPTEEAEQEEEGGELELGRAPALLALPPRSWLAAPMRSRCCPA